MRKREIEREGSKREGGRETKPKELRRRKEEPRE